VLDSVVTTAAAFRDGRAMTVPGTGLDWIVYRPDEFNRAVSTWLAGDRPVESVPTG
jgi:hypothetical protein